MMVCSMINPAASVTYTIMLQSYKEFGVWWYRVIPPVAARAYTLAALLMYIEHSPSEAG